MLRDIRSDYQKYALSEETIDKDPLVQLRIWLDEAIVSGTSDPTAMVLSTVDDAGSPDSRVVLLKEINQEGLVFFTNYRSKKGQQIAINRAVSLVFFWSPQERQVRVKGIAEKVSEEISSTYFRTRPVESQLGAWSSTQSETVESRKTLDDQFEFYKKKFDNTGIPRPENWGGYLIRPLYFEFWQGRPNRLHDRIAFTKSGLQWLIHRLAP